MGSISLYTGDDGQTHIEELSLADHPELADLQNAKGISFRESPAGRFFRAPDSGSFGRNWLSSSSAARVASVVSSSILLRRIA